MRHFHLAVWNAGCLNRHLSGKTYQDRLFVAHFAVITFGLITLLGAWHDPTQSMCAAFGLSALLALVFIGLASHITQRISIVPEMGELFVYCRREARRAWVLRELLEFIRRAHLSCGAPPRLAQHDLVPKGWGFGASDPRPFYFTLRR